MHSKDLYIKGMNFTTFVDTKSVFPPAYIISISVLVFLFGIFLLCCAFSKCLTGYRKRRCRRESMRQIGEEMEVEPVDDCEVPATEYVF